MPPTMSGQTFRVYPDGRVDCACPDSYLENGVVFPGCPEHAYPEPWKTYPRPEAML